MKPIVADTAWKRLAAFALAAMLTAGWLHAQNQTGAPAGPPRPPRPPKPERPPFDPHAAEALIRLQKDQIAGEERLLDLQGQLFDALGKGGEVKPDDPRLEEVRQLNRKLGLMRAQAMGLVKRLPPPYLLPPEEARLLAEQRDLIKDQMVKIRDGMEKLRNAAREGADAVPESPDPDKPPPPPKHPLPATAGEAGEAVHRGDVQTPRSLIETFMQIPDRDIPKANLDRYRRRAKP
ncbi:MAG: hypothetical protein HYY25_05150 [Candidatus Wallbacteria bacterium]|nr:hypothetical protein [Candidatus Wallbacteria bacterium]